MQTLIIIAAVWVASALVCLALWHAAVTSNFKNHDQ